LTNCIYLENEFTIVHGYKIYGSPLTPEFCGWAFMYQTDEEAKKNWEKVPDDVDILVTHGPPYGKEIENQMII
jgi:hypothetical protein